MRSDSNERRGWLAVAGVLLGLTASGPAWAGSVELSLPFTYRLVPLVEEEPTPEFDEADADVAAFALLAAQSPVGGPDESFSGRTELDFDSFVAATGISDATRFQSADLAVDLSVDGSITNDTGVNPNEVATSGFTTVGTSVFDFNLDMPSETLPITDTLAVSRSVSGSNASDAAVLGAPTNEGFGVSLTTDFDYTYSTVGDYDANGGFVASGLATLIYTFADVETPPTPNPVPTPAALPLGLVALAWAGRRRRRGV